MGYRIETTYRKSESGKTYDFNNYFGSTLNGYTNRFIYSFIEENALTKYFKKLYKIGQSPDNEFGRYEITLDNLGELLQEKIFLKIYDLDDNYWNSFNKKHPNLMAYELLQAYDINFVRGTINAENKNYNRSKLADRWTASIFLEVYETARKIKGLKSILFDEY